MKDTVSTGGCHRIHSSLWLRELEALVYGKCVDVSILNKVLNHAIPRTTFLGELPLANIVVVQCLDGPVHFAKETLMRHFRTFHDYFNSTSSAFIEIPFPKYIFQAAMMDVDGIPRLILVAECLDYLQPKNTLMFLDFDPVGCPLNVINRFHLRLTEGEKQKATSLFRVGVSDEKTNAILQVLIGMGESPYSYLLGNSRFALALLYAGAFNTYPSLEACLTLISPELSGTLPLDRFVHYVFGDGTCHSECIAELIHSYIYHSTIDNKATLVKVLTMCGINHAYFGNEREISSLPYNVTLAPSEKHSILHKHSQQIEKLLGAPIPVIPSSVN